MAATKEKGNMLGMFSCVLQPRWWQPRTSVGLWCIELRPDIKCVEDGFYAEYVVIILHIKELLARATEQETEDNT